MISTDRNLLNPETAVAKRHKEYGSLAEEIHIILFSSRAKHSKDNVSLSSNVHVYPTSSQGHWLYVIDAYRLGKKIIKENKITLISAQNPFETGIVAWLLSDKKIPFDLQLHTDPFTPFFVEGHHFINRLRVRMARFLLPRARSIRVVSARLQKHIARILPKAPPITTLPIFVDIKQTEKTVPTYDLHKLYLQFKTIILVLSRLEPEKNIGLGIVALSRLYKKFPDAGLVIVGKGSERAALEKIAEDNGVASRVVFHGFVSDTVSAFKTADIFLLMSDFEGYALTLVEAAAARLPIVTTDVGLVGDVLKDEESALVCPPRNVDCLTDKLDRFLADRKLRERFGRAAEEAVKRNILGTKEEYLEAYGRLWRD